MIDSPASTAGPAVISAAPPPRAAGASLPPDDPSRILAVSEVEGPRAEHIGMVGDTYTILLSSDDTAGRYALIDMYVPPGGGPALHRHDYDESFTVLEGQIELTFRGQRSIARTGVTVNIPANAPHRFTNATDRPARLLCVCAPTGVEQFFREVGVRVAGRTTPPPPLSDAEHMAFVAKAQSLGAKYRSEFLPPDSQSQPTTGATTHAI